MILPVKARDNPLSLIRYRAVSGFLFAFSMISNAKFKKLLGEKYSNLSDDEIEELKGQLYDLAFGMFEIWHKDNFVFPFPRCPP